MGTDLSEQITVDHGVHQGTVPGPLIFLLYVGDFSEKLQGENVIVHFADDTSIICYHSLKNHTNSDPEFSFKGEVIKTAHAYRYLGVQIDSNLTFEYHLDLILSKTRFTIFETKKRPFSYRLGLEPMPLAAQPQV